MNYCVFVYSYVGLDLAVIMILLSYIVYLHVPRLFLSGKLWLLIVAGATEAKWPASRLTQDSDRVSSQQGHLFNGAYEMLLISMSILVV